MDWIERLFHVSPDGGNGVTELAIVVALILCAVSLIAVRRRSRHGRDLAGKPSRHARWRS